MSKKKILATALACTAFGMSAWAANPIPTYETDAVFGSRHFEGERKHVEIDKSQTMQGNEGYKPGNTGTATDPAFYIKDIRLTSNAAFKTDAGLQAILQKYSNRSVKVSEIDSLTQEVTSYCRGMGYTIPQAVIPPQEIQNGVLEVKVYLAAYDEVGVAQNKSEVADSVLERYTSFLHSGDTITDSKLETALNNINDLPGVMARVVLRPGSQPATTSADIVVDHRPVWNNYVFVDNAGGYYSGKWRYGVNTELNNSGHIGDKLIMSGMLTNHDTRNYSVRYEMPIGHLGTRWGVGYSRNTYDFMNSGNNSIGKSQGLNFYGSTLVHRDRNTRVTAIYGYDHRDITDEFKLTSFGNFGVKTEKTSDVGHVGLTGSNYQNNMVTQYSMVYWFGHINTPSTEVAGDYQKLTMDLANIRYDGRFNYRFTMRSQLAEKALDSSEQFYLGGMNGVRAYGSSSGYGDNAIFGSYEVRYTTDVHGLELAAFVDAGAAKRKDTAEIDHRAGWGVGLRYAKAGDWYAQLDYARKFGNKRDNVEPDYKDKNGRLWLQVYKMF